MQRPLRGRCLVGAPLLQHSCSPKKRELDIPLGSRNRVRLVRANLHPSAAPTPGAAPPSSMGNFLDTPITEKETEVGEDESKGVCYGCARGDSRCAAPWRWPLPTPSHPDPSRGALGAGSPRCKGGARTWRTITSTCSPSLPSYHIYHSLGSLTGTGCAHSLVRVTVSVRVSKSP